MAKSKKSSLGKKTSPLTSKRKTRRLSNKSGNSSKKVNDSIANIPKIIEASSSSNSNRLSKKTNQV